MSLGSKLISLNATLMIHQGTFEQLYIALNTCWLQEQRQSSANNGTFNDAPTFSENCRICMVGPNTIIVACLNFHNRGSYVPLNSDFPTATNLVLWVLTSPIRVTFPKTSITYSKETRAVGENSFWNIYLTEQKRFGRSINIAPLFAIRRERQHKQSCWARDQSGWSFEE